MKQSLLLYSKTHIWNTGCESSKSYISYSGANVPPMVLSLLGARVRGNESSSYRPKPLEMPFSNNW